MQTEGGDPGRVSLNLSLKQLRQASFILRCRSVFRRHGVSPTSFELEITETTLMADAKRTVRLLDELYAMGLHLSIDDFGTGYSSLSALQQFPIGTLKIDQSFVRDVSEDAGDATIVRTIIEMGRSLGMEVVAEGVESLRHLDFLRRNTCHYRAGQAVRRAVHGGGAAGASDAAGRRHRAVRAPAAPRRRACQPLGLNKSHRRTPVTARARDRMRLESRMPFLRRCATCQLHVARACGDGQSWRCWPGRHRVLANQQAACPPGTHVDSPWYAVPPRDVDLHRRHHLRGCLRPARCEPGDLRRSPASVIRSARTASSSWTTSCSTDLGMARRCRRRSARASPASCATR